MQEVAKPSADSAQISSDRDLWQVIGEIDWDFTDADTARDGHAVLPYPAKFPPQIPESLIRTLSQPDDLVLDCFGGSGTTAVEAARAGRRAYSIDANPVGTLLTRLKTADLSADDRDTLLDVAGGVRALRTSVTDTRSLWRPEIPNVHRWYTPQVVEELAKARAFILSNTHGGPVRDAAMAGFIQAATRMSFQDSETRYKSTKRSIAEHEATERVAREIERLGTRLPEEVRGWSDVCAVTGDARDRSVYPPDSSVGLVVTSPPYPNAYDYHLYHRFRIFWLGEAPASLRSVEIGSHLKNQARKDPIEAYERDMTDVLGAVRAVLAPGRYATFVVGDGLHKGELYNTDEAITRLALALGFDHVGTIERSLPASKRSVTGAGRRLKEESIVVLRTPALGDTEERRDPTYELFDYERTLARRELERLGGSGATRINHAAFSSHVRADGSPTPTLQLAAEATVAPSNRKNSTYAGHGIHRYKGKFYPQLAKALLNIVGAVEREGVVLDPFGGSGTLALEASLAGLHSVSVDINPVAINAARAKQALLACTVDQIREARGLVHTKLPKEGLSDPWTVFEPDTHDEIRSWFPPPVVRKLGALLSAVRSEEVAAVHEAMPMIFEVLASDLIRECSQQEPSDLRVRRRRSPIDDADVFGAFFDRLVTLIERQQAFRVRSQCGPSEPLATILSASAADPRTFTHHVFGSGISAVVSSPPYGTALPYLDTDRLSLAAVYNMSKRSRTELEDRLIGSREINKREQQQWEELLGASPDLPATTVTFLEALHCATKEDVSAGFRKQRGPALLLRYFVQMQEVLSNIVSNLVRHGEVALVLGDSTTIVGGHKWLIPTVDEVAAIAKAEGLSLVDDLPITVTRENLKNARHAITSNRIIRLRKD